MNIIKSYLLAESVVCLFEFLAKESDDETNAIIYPHLNGRETGFNINIYGKNLPPEGISFFIYGHRNSNDICITVSNVIEWMYVTEKDCKNEKCFGHDVQKAVDYILKHVTGELHLGKSFGGTEK